MAWGKAVRIDLTDAERAELERRSRRRTIGRADVMRAAIVNRELRLNLHVLARLHRE